MSRIEIFTPKQRMVMAKNMQPWLEDMYKKAAPAAFEKQLENLSFRHVPGEHCWLYGGTRKVQMQLIQEGIEGVGEPFEVKVFSSDDAFYDVKFMAEQMLEAKLDYLSNHPGRAAYMGLGGDLEALKKLAKEFLVADIRAEKDYMNMFSFKAREGRCVVATVHYNSWEAELPITFNSNGLCSANSLALLFEERFASLLRTKEINIFEMPHMRKLKVAIAHEMLKALRDPGYTYPYSNSTIALLKDLRPTIMMSAEHNKLSPIAIAEAFVENLGKQMTPGKEKIYDEIEAGMRAFMVENPELMDCGITLGKEGLKTLLRVKKPQTLVLDFADAWWSTVDGRAKGEVYDLFARFLYSAFFWATENIDTGMAEHRDKYVEDMAKLQLKQTIDVSKMPPGEFEKFQKELKQLLKNNMPQKVFWNYYIYFGPKYGGPLLSKATAINQLLTVPEFKEYNDIYLGKWERLREFLD